MQVQENGANYILRVPAASKALVASLMAYRGLTFSTSASSKEAAILWATNPYALADLATEATPALLGYRKQIDLSRALDGIGTRRLPPGKELWAYQKATLDYQLKRKGGINGDQPGLGKTPTSIAYCNEREAQRVLVICPASVRLQWAVRIHEWTTIPQCKVSTMLKVKDGIHPTAHYQIISYEAARNPAIIRAISKYDWDVLICDEAHKMKNWESITTRAILGNSKGEFNHGEHKMKAIAGHCAEHLALTGTLLLNRPSECLDGLTLVLTNRGWVPIVQVKKTDLLWDGLEWVSHDGLLYQGCAKTVSVGKILATATHLFQAKSTWVSVDEVHLNTALWKQVLARGSARLPFAAIPGILAVRKLSNAIVTVAVKPAQLFKSCVKALRSGAGRAEPKTDRLRQIQNIMRFVPISNYASDYSQSCRVSGTAAPIQKTTLGSPMADEAFASGITGSKIARSGWRILFLYQAMKIRLCNWIAPTTVRDMSREICDLLPERKIWATAELSRIYRRSLTLPWKKSGCSEPVYDLANAGPRQRFTVLSADGPIISHNCYVLFRFFDWEAIDFASEEKFKDRYNRQADMKTIEGKRFKLESTSLETELQNRLRTNIMARHEKKDVFPLMKQPRFGIVTVEESGAIKGALDAEGMLGIDIDEIQTTKDFEILGHIAEARRLMGVAMAPQIADYAADFLDGSEEKLVIFAWHIEVLDILENVLARFGTVRVDGRKSPNARQKAVDDFIGNSNIRVFIGNIQSAGTGLDGLQTVCSRCYLAEPDWVPANNEQAVARLDRIGQLLEVMAELFVAPGSISEKILVKALEKMNVIFRVLDAREK